MDIFASIRSFIRSILPEFRSTGKYSNCFQVRELLSCKYGEEYGGRWCCVSSGRFSFFGRRSPFLVHLESVNNTLIEEKVTCIALF